MGKSTIANTQDETNSQKDNSTSIPKETKGKQERYRN
jgi:hypothetical protein